MPNSIPWDRNSKHTVGGAARLVVKAHFGPIRTVRRILRLLHSDIAWARMLYAAQSPGLLRRRLARDTL